MSEFKTPGVYIREIPKLPPSIASVETAIPAFIGFTEKATRTITDDLIKVPTRITSLLEYERYFGKTKSETGIEVAFTTVGSEKTAVASINNTTASKFMLYYCMQLFFANGGGPCYVISADTISSAGTSPVQTDMDLALAEAAKIDEITLLLMPELLNVTAITSTNYYASYKLAIDQCQLLKDRFTVMDVMPTANAIADLRSSGLGSTIDYLKYGAAYYPRLFTRIPYYNTNEADITISGATSTDLAALKGSNTAEYNIAKAAINNLEMLLPASPAVVGVYAATDSSRGVWKAPANVNINLAIRPSVMINGKEQETMNVDAVSGKSVNVIRSFPGRGPAIIWGARTLAGNDNEWRYIPVRRYFNMVEESAKNAIEQFVFEPNDRNTWIRVKAMLENYFTQQWKDGALMGASTKEAFFVHVGLGETMSELDIWEGRMIVDIGLAAVRPAEFIILRFMHKMLSEA